MRLFDFSYFPYFRIFRAFGNASCCIIYVFAETLARNLLPVARLNMYSFQFSNISANMVENNLFALKFSTRFVKSVAPFASRNGDPSQPKLAQNWLAPSRH